MMYIQRNNGIHKRINVSKMANNMSTMGDNSTPAVSKVRGRNDWMVRSSTWNTMSRERRQRGILAIDSNAPQTSSSQQLSGNAVYTVTCRRIASLPQNRSAQESINYCTIPTMKSSVPQSLYTAEDNQRAALIV